MKGKQYIFLSIFHAGHWLNPALPRMGGHGKDSVRKCRRKQVRTYLFCTKAGVNLKPGFFSNDARLIEMTGTSGYPAFASARRIKPI